MTETTTHAILISDAIDSSAVQIEGNTVIPGAKFNIEAIPADTTDHSAALSATFTTAAIIAVLVLVLVLLGAKGGRK